MRRSIIYNDRMARQRPIQQIVFDFGGVLMHGEIEAMIPYLADKYGTAAPVAFQTRVLDDWRRAMTNPAHDRAFWQCTAQALHIPVRRLFEEFMAFPKPQKDVIAIARRLRRSYPLAMLTDQIRSWHLPLMKRFRLHAAFPTVVTSYNEHVAKPDARIFTRLTDRLGIDPQVCLIVDDRKENIRAALHLGMRAVRFTDAAALKRELKKMGVSV